MLTDLTQTVLSLFTLPFQEIYGYVSKGAKKGFVTVYEYVSKGAKKALVTVYEYVFIDSLLV